jgi:hypothetical protein
MMQPVAVQGRPSREQDVGLHPAAVGRPAQNRAGAGLSCHAFKNPEWTNRGCAARNELRRL